MKEDNKIRILKEAEFSFSKSSGPGGQNVNKVSSKAEIRFNIFNTQVLSEEEKQVILQKLKNRITTEGFLTITAQDSRSQIANKQLAEKKLIQLIEAALRKKKKRIASKPTATSVEQRLKLKKNLSQKKANRRGKDFF